MDFARSKSQLARRRLFAIQFFQDFNRYCHDVIFKLIEAQWIVKKYVGIENKNLCLVFFVFLFLQE